jgi:hypothetical protein
MPAVFSNSSQPPTFNSLERATTQMARKVLAKEQVVKLIVGAGQASPSPPVGPALGSKGVKSMDFCKVCCIGGTGKLLEVVNDCYRNLTLEPLT